MRLAGLMCESTPCGATATRAFTHNVDYAVELTVCLLMAHNLALCYLPVYSPWGGWGDGVVFLLAATCIRRDLRHGLAARLLPVGVSAVIVGLVYVPLCPARNTVTGGNSWR
jgi:hypothetical protein